MHYQVFQNRSSEVAKEIGFKSFPRLVFVLVSQVSNSDSNGIFGVGRVGTGHVRSWQQGREILHIRRYYWTSIDPVAHNAKNCVSNYLKFSRIEVYIDSNLKFLGYRIVYVINSTMGFGIRNLPSLHVLPIIDSICIF